MKYHIANSPIVILAALAALSGIAFAQDHDQQHQSDQPTTGQSSDHGTEHAQSSDTRRDTSRNGEERRSDSDHRVAAADDNDMTARYRSEHPHAAAHCKDGFFTNTTDRKRACSKHGGIDVWLLQ